MADWQHKYREEDWVGKRYGNLTIAGYDYKERQFRCLCDCGKEKFVKPSFLFNGKVKTCGLSCPIHISRNPGVSRERLHWIWSGMKRRCNPDIDSRYYSNRGITVCDEWANSYEAFKKWALSNGYRDDLTIDRIDSDGNYEPGNCRWATYKEQRDNARDPYTLTERPRFKKGELFEVDGEWKTKPEWCSIYGVSEPFVTYRMKKKGMTMKEALTTPKQTGRPLGT